MFLVLFELFKETLSAGVMPSFLDLLWQLRARGHIPVSLKRQNSYLPLFSWHISMVLFHPISFLFCWNSALMGDLSWQLIASMDSFWYFSFFTTNTHLPKTKSKQTKPNYNKKPNKQNQTKQQPPPQQQHNMGLLVTHHVTVNSAFGACLLVCMCVITWRPKEACHILSIIPGYNLLTLSLFCSSCCDVLLWHLICLLLVEVRTSNWVQLDAAGQKN